jgi:hypothetical protein
VKLDNENTTIKPNYLNDNQHTACKATPLHLANMPGPVEQQIHRDPALLYVHPATTIAWKPHD